MRLYIVTPFVAGALICLLAIFSPVGAIAFSAACLALLLLCMLEERARERKRDKIIADARLHADLLTVDNYREHLPPIKRALAMIINGK